MRGTPRHARLASLDLAVTALASLVLVWTTPGLAAEPASPVERWRDRIREEVDAARFGAGVLLCEQAQTEVTFDTDLRALCARSYVGLGDRLRASGSAANARKRWEEAATLDPRLMDDPDFIARLEASGTVPDARPGDPKPGDAKPNSKPKDPPPAEPRPRALPDQDMPLPRRAGGMPEDAGPRWDRGLGLGLSFGFDGLAAVTVGWITDETIVTEVSFGIAYPTADVRVRWYGLKQCLTPVLGAGLMVPFGKSDRLGLGLSGFDSLYELGEAFHLDIGLAYTPVHRLDLFAGVAFVTPFDQDHPDTVLFFPQFAGSATWYF